MSLFTIRTEFPDSSASSTARSPAKSRRTTSRLCSILVGINLLAEVSESGMSLNRIRSTSVLAICIESRNMFAIPSGVPTSGSAGTIYPIRAVYLSTTFSVSNDPFNMLPAQLELLREFIFRLTFEVALANLRVTLRFGDSPWFCGTRGIDVTQDGIRTAMQVEERVRVLR
jgi:hypothetical protein